MVNNKAAVVVLSGGLDSTTALYEAKNEYEKVYAFSVNYGQRHSKELHMATATCKKLKVEHQILDFPNMKEIMKGSSLTDNIDVPEGHYAAENMKSTVVPNRNMILLSLAAAYAISKGAEIIIYGAHSGDHAIYPDCRPEFISQMQKVFLFCDYNPLLLRAPFGKLDKGDIIIKGIALGVDYSHTWTCYKGHELACGKCGSCVERLEAFKKAGVTDPIKYQEGD